MHSSIRILTKHGVTPDFQFSADSHSEEAAVASLQLLPNIPLITAHSPEKRYTEIVERVLLCGNKRDTNIVTFEHNVNFNGPSSTNLAFSFATVCQPKRIYLLGCDFGFKNINKLYTAGSSHDEKVARHKTEHEDFYHSDKTQAQIRSNFDPSTLIGTNTEFLETLSDVEQTIAAIDQQLRPVVYNLSEQGAFIQGTTPKHSKDIHLPKYKSKEQDIKQILAAFHPAKEGQNWSRLDGNGADLLNLYKRKLIAQISNDSFQWESFSTALDSAAYGIVNELKVQPDDGRLSCYASLFEQLLRLLYNSIIRMDFPEEAQQVYQYGAKLFAESIQDIEWPDELKDY